MRIIVIGDVHGDFRIIDTILNTTHANFYVQVGDLGSPSLRYPDLEKPLIFIPGNKENADFLGKFPQYDGKVLIKKNLWYLPIGESTTFRGISIAGFGGNYSENYYYEERGRLQGRHRLHFTKRDYLRMLDTASKIDILLTHEAPSPFIVPRKFKGDRGKKIISKLVEVLQPKYNFFGHHNVSFTNTLHRSICKCISNNCYLEVEI
jgi:Icc-related predicted phosphoesterase